MFDGRKKWVSIIGRTYVLLKKEIVLLQLSSFINNFFIKSLTIKSCRFDIGDLFHMQSNRRLVFISNLVIIKYIVSGSFIFADIKILMICIYSSRRKYKTATNNVNYSS